MADIAPNDLATFYVDLPGGDADTITLTLTDPLGTVVVDSDATVPLGSNRYTYTLTTGLTVEGVYQAAWHYLVADKDVGQVFTVGSQPGYGLTKYDVRIQIASRLRPVYYGQVSVADTSTLVDDTLVGGAGEFRYWYIVLDPATDDRGRVFRIRDYNGMNLELSLPFLSIPDVGTNYTLFQLDPREIDRAMHLAISELAQQVRIDLRLTDLVVDADDRLVVPTGITHVSELWSNGTKLKPTEWSMMPGRRIQFVTTPDAPTELVGQRVAYPPLWEDSIVEVDPPSVVARASNFLHAARAAGAGIDNDEHLRRQLAAADEYERARRGAVGRIPPGSRSVLA